MKIDRIIRGTSLLLLLFCAHARLSAQMDYAPHGASPDAMALIRAIQSPVDHATGTATVRVPLHTAVNHGLQVPIALSYRTSGIRVEDMATQVGLGWNISAGGKVTRVVKGGYPDEHATGGFLHNWWSSKTIIDLYNYVYNSGWVGRNEMYALFRQRDTEPDMFYFEIAGRSGMFMLDHDGNAMTIPAQEVRIEFVNRQYFEITDENGVNYVFGNTELSRETSKVTFPNDNINGGISDGKKQTNTYVSTWFMDSMEDLGGNRITFGYTSPTNEPVKYEDRRVQWEKKGIRANDLWAGDVDWGSGKTKTSTILINKPRYLSSITTPTGTVAFSYSDVSEVDGDRGPDRLDSILVYGMGGTPLKSVKLGYSIVNSRLYLNSVSERFPGVADPVKIAGFEYNSAATIVSRDSKDFDHWGYYNAAGNGTQVRPTVNINDRVTYVGASRAPDLTATKWGSLHRITYPTGGFTEYVYELNRSKSWTTPVGGLRIREIVTGDGAGGSTKVSYWYTASGEENGASSGILVRETVNDFYYDIISYDFGNHYNVSLYSKPTANLYDVLGAHIVYSTVAEVMPDGSKTVYEFSTSEGGDYKDIIVTDNYTENNDDGYWQPRAKEVRQSRFWRRGLPLSQSHYDAGGNLVSNTKNYYSFDTPVYTIESYYIYSLGIDNERLYYFDWVSEPVRLDSVVVDRGPYNTASRTAYDYQGKLHPVAVTQTNAQGDTVVTRTRYSFDYDNVAPTPGSGTMAIIRKLMNHNVLVPIETTVTRNGRVVSGEYNEYKTIQVRSEGGTTTREAVVPAQRRALLTADGIPENSFVASHFPNSVNMAIDPNYREAETYNVYDKDGGVLLSSRDGFGYDRSVVYGYGGALPVATVDNAVYNREKTTTTGTIVIREPSYEPAPAGSSYSVQFTSQPWEFDLDLHQSEHLRVFVSFVNGTNPNYQGSYSYNVYEANYYNPGSSMSLGSGGGSFDPGYASPSDAGSFPTGSYKVVLYLQPYNFTDPYASANVTFEYARAEYDPGESVTTTTVTGYSQVLHTSFEDVAGSVANPYAKTGARVWSGNYNIDVSTVAAGLYNITWWSSTDNGVTWVKQGLSNENIMNDQASLEITAPSGAIIDEVRLMPQGARMTTYTYKPGVGRTSEMDHNGRVTYWEYDAQGRPVRELDNDRNPVREYRYHILNQ